MKIQPKVFASLVTYYVGAIRNGAVPCVESALRSMSIIENEKAVKDTVDTYIKEMNGKLALPTPDQKTFLDLHIHCKTLAFAVFQKQSVMDDGNKYKLEADSKIDKEHSHFDERNKDESVRRCNEVLKELHQVIAEKLRRGIYTVAGGYNLYKADRLELDRRYQAMPDLGVTKQEMYVDFTHLTKNEEESVLQSDQMVTKKEKEAELSLQNAKLAKERELFFKQQSENANNEMVRTRQRLEEEIKSLKEQQTKDMKKMQEHYEKVTDKRIAEMQRLEKENMTVMKEESRAELQRAMDKQDAKAAETKAMTDHYEYMLNEQNKRQENNNIEFQKRIDVYETTMTEFNEKLANKENVIGELNEKMENDMQKLETLNRQSREENDRKLEDEIKTVTAEQKQTQKRLEEQEKELNRIKEEEPTLAKWIKYRWSKK